MRRPQLLAGVLTVRCVTVAAAGILLATNGPWSACSAAIDGLASTVLRPIRGTLVPMIARSPDELVAANVGITTGMSAASLLGPAVAAVILVAGSVEATFLLASALFVVARQRAACGMSPTPRNHVRCSVPASRPDCAQLTPRARSWRSPSASASSGAC